MAVKSPDLDLRRYLKGGSDAWDNPQASVILLDDYFVEDVPPPGGSGQIKAFVGGSFVAKPVKVWNGSAWATKPLKRWNGSAWVATNY